MALSGQQSQLAVDGLLVAQSMWQSTSSMRRIHSPASCLSKQLDAYGALSAALAVILSFMAETKHVVLIHGSWGRELPCLRWPFTAVEPLPDDLAEALAKINSPTSAH